jgi:hypothetical protein
MAVAIVILALFIFGLCALSWELHDFEQVTNLQSAAEFDGIEKEQALMELACYSYDHGVSWRMAFFAALIIGLTVFFLFYESITLTSFFLVLLIVFFTFYFTKSLSSYHYDRELCRKARKTLLF